MQGKPKCANYYSFTKGLADIFKPAVNATLLLKQKVTPGELPVKPIPDYLRHKNLAIDNTEALL